MSLAGLASVMRREAEIVASQRATTKIGIVSGIHKSKHAAKVMIQPEGVESGWLPVGTVAIGKGWGLHCLPSLGDQVVVHFVDGDLASGVIGMRVFSLADAPAPSESGEFQLIHQSGSYLKFLANGMVLMKSAAAMTIESAASLTLKGGSVTIEGPLGVSGNVSVTGNITATGTITP